MGFIKNLMWRGYYLLPEKIKKRVYVNYMAKKQFPFPKFFPSETKPKVCFSFDFELALGAVHARHSWKRSLMLEGRKNFFSLLNLLEKYKTKATFGVCGHLFLKECKRINGIAHPEIRRIKTEWYKGDWFREDPCSNWKENKYWYAPDLVEKLIEKGHEIACHSFSHIDFSHKSCTQEIALQEIAECKKAAKEYGVEFKSFIFPYHRISHLDILKEQGFKLFRTSDYFVGDVKVNQGLIEIPMAAEITKNINIETYLNILKKGIENGGIIHFFSHPWEMDKEVLEKTEQVLIFVEKMSKLGKIDLVTMGDFVDGD